MPEMKFALVRLEPSAKRAHRLVRDAIQRGALTRPATCSRCGRVPPRTSDGRAAIQAHHHDYAKPLDVEWICPACHREETPLPEKIGAPAIGEINGQAKLTESQVRCAREMHRRGITHKEIGDAFGVSKWAIGLVCRGKAWRHVR